MPHTVALGTSLGTVYAASCRSDEPRRRPPPPRLSSWMVSPAPSFLCAGWAVAAGSPEVLLPSSFPAALGPGPSCRCRQVRRGRRQRWARGGWLRRPPAGPGAGGRRGVRRAGGSARRRAACGAGPGGRLRRYLPRGQPPSPRRCRGRLEACMARGLRLSLSGEPPCAAGAGGRHRFGRWAVPAGPGSQPVGRDQQPPGRIEPL